MSDMLQEEEGQMSAHQTNASGNCSISGCPCRGWSQREGVVSKESKHPLDECQYDYGDGVRCCIYRSCHPAKGHLNHGFTEQSVEASQHEPAARGGGDVWDIESSDSLLGRRRIRDMNTNRVVAVANSDDDAQQILTEHNQHQSLVAEREQLQSAVRNALITLKNYEDETGIKCPLTIKLLEDAISNQKGQPQ